MDILAGAIDIPEQDMAAGVARRPAKQGLAGRVLRIHHSESKPDHAYIAVAFRDGWFYIDERDLETKRYFKLLGLPDGIVFSTQDQIDNFQTNYPGCTRIDGDVLIQGYGNGSLPP